LFIVFFFIKSTPRGPQLVSSGLMLATALAPVIGYEAAANIAKKAAANGQTIAEVAAQEIKLSDEELKKLLDPVKMVEPSDTILPTSG
jgi:fumarate hydratase class II